MTKESDAEPALKPLMTLLRSAGVEHLIESLRSHGIGCAIERQGSRLVLLVEEQAPEPLLAQLVHDWRLQEASRRGMVDVKGLSAFTTRAMKNFPWTLALMALNIVCLPAGLWLADAGEVTSMLKALSLYPLELTPQGYVLVPAVNALEAGEWWRLVSPMLLHFSWLHITFNLLWVWEVGRRIEFAHGVPWFLGVTVIASVAANGLQAWLAPLQLFGGMSGVVFAYLSYVMVWDWFRPALKIGLAKGIYIVMLAYLALGFSGLIDLLGLGSLANGAHLGGLLAGVVLASVRAMWNPASVAPGQ